MCCDSFGKTLASVGILLASETSTTCVLAQIASGNQIFVFILRQYIALSLLLQFTHVSANSLSYLCDQQIYLLTPMDRGTLLNAKSTISHGPPSLIIPGIERRSIENCYADREMSVITTYLNDNAKLHLIVSLSICYTANFATNTVTNRTDGT